VIYTIGFAKNYDKFLGVPGFEKLGKKKGYGYSGGSVWPSVAAARRHLTNNQPRLAGYAIYGVEADWEKDVEVLPDDPPSAGRLLRNAKIIGKFTTETAIDADAPYHVSVAK
jgi:hypothetical protein